MINQDKFIGLLSSRTKGAARGVDDFAKVKTSRVDQQFSFPECASKSTRAVKMLETSAVPTEVYYGLPTELALQCCGYLPNENFRYYYAISSHCQTLCLMIG